MNTYIAIQCYASGDGNLVEMLDGGANMLIVAPDQREARRRIDEFFQEKGWYTKLDAKLGEPNPSADYKLFPVNTFIPGVILIEDPDGVE